MEIAAKNQFEEKFPYEVQIEWLASSQGVTTRGTPTVGHFKINSFAVKRYFYAIRAYNKQLDEEEIAKNAVIDKARFGI